MKISPVTAPSNSVSGADPNQGRAESLRSMKMNTNATPGIYEPAAQELTIPDNSEPNQTVEATQPISPQFAALAKQRRALQVKERELLNLKKELEARSQGSEHIPVSRIKSETLKVLEEAGVTYDDLTAAILGNQVDPKVSALEAQIKALEQGVEKKLIERDTREEEQLYREVTRDAQSIIAQKAADFELLQKMGRLPVAVEIWRREYKQTGEFPDIEGILRDVEEHCLKECQEYTGLKKVQELFKQPETIPQTQQRTGMRTLTNKDTASIPMSAKARALAAFHGTLRK